MMVPTPIVKLNKPHAVLDEAAGQQTIVGKRRIIPFVEDSRIVSTFGRRDEAGLCTVEVEHMLWLLRDVHDIRNCRLHSIS